MVDLFQQIINNSTKALWNNPQNHVASLYFVAIRVVYIADMHMTTYRIFDCYEANFFQRRQMYRSIIPLESPHDDEQFELRMSF